MKYFKLPGNLWYEEPFQNYSDKTKLLSFYLLTSHHRITEGLYRLPKNYICADLEWSKEELEKPFNELLKMNFIYYDEKMKVVFIPSILDYQSPQNPNQEKAAIKKLKAIKNSCLMPEFIKKVKRVNETFFERLKKEFGESPSPPLFPNPAPAPSPIHSQNGKVVELEKVLELTYYLIDLIKNNNPRANVPKKKRNDPSLKKWAKEIERLHRLGPVGAKERENKGYSWKEIKKIIEFSQNNDFWKSNILSAYKLRKQVIKLENKMKMEYNASYKKTDMLKELYADACKEDKKNAKK